MYYCVVCVFVYRYAWGEWTFLRCLSIPFDIDCDLLFFFIITKLFDIQIANWIFLATLNRMHCCCCCCWNWIKWIKPTLTSIPTHSFYQMELCNFFLFWWSINVNGLANHERRLSVYCSSHHIIQLQKLNHLPEIKAINKQTKSNRKLTQTHSHTSIPYT